MDQSTKDGEFGQKKDGAEQKVWRTPKVTTVPIKQVTRGGLMIGADMWSRCNVFTMLCS